MATPTGEAVPFYVAIAGNIGVGKTMVTDLLGERLGWDTYYEPVDNNPYLDDFYADMRRFSFHLQVFFLSKRWELQRAILETGHSAVQDRTIYEDTEIFARILFRRGLMEERDYLNYQALFNCMVVYLRPPDLILYMRAQPEAILSRISTRGRDCEKGIDPEYIRELHEAYEHWSQRMHRIAPVHVIDTERVNLRDDRKAQDELVERIRAHSREKDLREAAGVKAARTGGRSAG